MEFVTLLKELCSINGTSGDEKNVREYIIEHIKDKCEYKTDNLGNIIAFVKGKKTPKKKLMISAHMDEVGMIITSVKSDGTLTFSPVGGIDPRVVIGRNVKIGNISGVIGSKAVHNLSASEREKAAEFSGFYIDIGTQSAEETEKLVSLGDYAYFDSEIIKLGDDLLCSKAIDDRFGCAIMIMLINSKLEYDTAFTFVVQEEVGLRGARVAAFTVDPDFALVLEATTAADIPSVSGAERCCELGKGPVVSYMDRSTIYDREMYELSKQLAEENNIPWQTKTMVAGGNDSGAIHISRGGVRTLAVSVPCRYLHSPASAARISDMENSLKLVSLMMNRVCEL